MSTRDEKIQRLKSWSTRRLLPVDPQDELPPAPSTPQDKPPPSLYDLEESDPSPTQEELETQLIPIDWDLVKTRLIADACEEVNIDETLTLCKDNNDDHLYEVSRRWWLFLHTSPCVTNPLNKNWTFKKRQLCRFHPLSLSERFHHYNDGGAITKYDPAMSSCRLFTIHGIKFYLQMRQQNPGWKLNILCMVPVENFAIFR